MRLGIALSGGGVRGAAHAGAMRALEGANVRPSYISGTSAGAIAAGIMACGHGVGGLEAFVAEVARQGKKLADVDVCGIAGAMFGRPVDGLLKGDRAYRLLREVCGKRLLNQALIPLIIPAVDINAGRLVLFVSDKGAFAGINAQVVDDIPIVDAVRASIAIPGVFRPFYMDGLRLVDGGVLNVLPADLLFSLGADTVLGVNVGYYGEPVPGVDDALEIVMQSISLMTYTIARMRTVRSDYVLNVDLGDIGTLDFSRAPEAMRIGYLTAMRGMPDLLAAITKASASRAPRILKRA